MAASFHRATMAPCLARFRPSAISTLPPWPRFARGWLDLGAWVCGDPAWIYDSQVAGIPLLLPLSRMRARSARRFLAEAA